MAYGDATGFQFSNFLRERPPKYTGRRPREGPQVFHDGVRVSVQAYFKLQIAIDIIRAALEKTEGDEREGRPVVLALFL